MANPEKLFILAARKAIPLAHAQGEWEWVVWIVDLLQLKYPRAVNSSHRIFWMCASSKAAPIEID